MDVETYGDQHESICMGYYCADQGADTNRNTATTIITTTKQNENDQFLQSNEDIMKELNDISATISNPSQSISMMHNQERPSGIDSIGAQPSVAVAELTPLNVSAIISDDMLPTPPTAIIENIKPTYAQYADPNGAHVNYSQVFEQRSSVCKEMSLVRYREKRLKRMFNRVRYSLKREVSQARPRVKGRFVKTNPNDCTASNNSVTSPMTTCSNATSTIDSSDTFNIPLKELNPALEVQSPNSLPSVNGDQHSVFDNVRDLSSSHDDRNAFTPESIKINPKKRKSSFFLISKKSFFPLFGKEDSLSIAPKSPSSRPFQHSISSILKRGSSDVENDVDLHDNLQEKSLNEQWSNQTESAKKPSYWTQKFNLFA